MHLHPGLEPSAPSNQQASSVFVKNIHSIKQDHPFEICNTTAVEGDVLEVRSEGSFLHCENSHAHRIFCAP